jgi:hypothetical protein
MTADRSLRVFSFSSRRYQPDQATSWRQSSNCRVLPVDVVLAARSHQCVCISSAASRSVMEPSQGGAF